MSRPLHTMKYLAYDSETFLIGPCNVAPQMVCCTFAEIVTNPLAELVSSSIFAACDPDLPEMLEEILLNPDVTIIAQYAAFDMAVICATFPQLIPAVFKAYDDQRIHCTIIREKEINLSTIGEIDFRTLPDGGSVRIGYELKNFSMEYFNEDISESKDASDSWRLNYSSLAGKPIEEYPEDAKEYAMHDAVLALRVYFAQNERGGTLATHAFHAASDFSLYLCSCWGLQVDPAETAKIQAMLEIELAPEKQNLLLESGVLDPGEEPREHKKTPGKFTKGRKPSIKKAVLAQLVQAVSEANGIEIKYTDGREDKVTGEREPGISCDAEVMDRIAHLDPILTQYEHRQKLQKLVTTEIPRMLSPTGIVHPTFDVLKKSGRFSSKASELFPSLNVANVDPRVRQGYVPRPGWLMLSCDLASIELVTLAQKLLTLFGESLLADLINAGKNPHDYLGAQLAYSFDDKFRESCDKAKAQDRMQVYDIFYALREIDKPFYKKYRTFAKPTGLGYPGGLGAEKFVTYAKATFQVVITIEEAEQFKQIWFDSYPEMRQYFRWVNNDCKDPNDPTQQTFAYTSPLGMLRARADYCSVANGAGMQTPAAEGFKLAFYEFVRACYDFSAPNPLLGCHPLAPIYDEILAEIPDDEFSHERALHTSELMVKYMRQITPDVLVKAEPKLMRRWYKEAEQAFDSNGRLIPWAPNL